MPNLDDFLASEVEETSRVFDEAAEKAHRARMRKAVRRLYDIHHADTISEARFFAVMWGMTSC